MPKGKQSKSFTKQEYDVIPLIDSLKGVRPEDIDKYEKLEGIKIRAKLLNFVTKIIATFLAITLAAIVLDGFGLWGFKLSDNVAGLLGGSAMVEAFSLLGVAVAGLRKTDK